MLVSPEHALLQLQCLGLLVPGRFAVDPGKVLW